MRAGEIPTTKLIGEVEHDAIRSACLLVIYLSVAEVTYLLGRRVLSFYGYLTVILRDSAIAASYCRLENHGTHYDPLLQYCRSFNTIAPSTPWLSI